MAHIVRPDVRYQRSYLAAHDEFAGAHRDGDGVWAQEADGEFAGFEFTRESLAERDEFARFVLSRRADELPETPRPGGCVPCTFLWIVEGEEYLGSIALRHELNDVLLREGGHIGFSIRPSARRRGHATTALAQTLELAHELGMERVLVCCAEDNTDSLRIIEAAGGTHEDSRNGQRRYWVPTISTDQPHGVRPR